MITSILTFLDTRSRTNKEYNLCCFKTLLLKSTTVEQPYLRGIKRELWDLPRVAGCRCFSTRGGALPLHRYGTVCHGLVRYPQSRAPGPERCTQPLPPPAATPAAPALPGYRPRSPAHRLCGVYACGLCADRPPPALDLTALLDLLGPHPRRRTHISERETGAVEKSKVDHGHADALLTRC